jgi:hypothetical protein
MDRAARAGWPAALGGWEAVAEKCTVRAPSPEAVRAKLNGYGGLQMIKTVVASVMAAACLLVSSVVVADPARFATTWSFKIEYLASGQISESREPADSAAILMPSGSQWSCKRRAVTVYKNGLHSGGFRCAMGSNAVISVHAICSLTAAGSDTGAASSSDGEGDDGNGLHLTVQCVTKALAATPAKVAVPKPVAPNP